MSMRSRFWPVGLALLLGGMTTGICHLFEFDSPRDVSHLSQYAPLSATLHLILFAGGMVILLGWFGHYALQHSQSGAIGFTSFVCLFLGIMWGDLLHSILEFTVFPVLNTEVPYALPGMADATYRSAPLSFLLTAGHLLLVAGIPAAALSVYRSAIVPAWTAIPFAFTTALQVLSMLPRWGLLGKSSLVSLYFSLAILGAAILWSKTRNDFSPARHTADRLPTYREDSRPAGR